MPKKVITKSNIDRVFRELDRWDGKLTWPLFCDRLAKVLGVDSVSRHTLYAYPAIRERFQQRQKDLREQRDSRPRNYSLETAAKRIRELKPQVKRLQETNDLLLDQFRRWQYNAYAHGVRMDQLELDVPLPAVDRSGHG
jgi:hypothetical protein